MPSLALSIKDYCSSISGDFEQTCPKATFNSSMVKYFSKRILVRKISGSHVLYELNVLRRMLNKLCIYIPVKTAENVFTTKQIADRSTLCDVAAAILRAFGAG